MVYQIPDNMRQLTVANVFQSLRNSEKTPKNEFYRCLTFPKKNMRREKQRAKPLYANK